MGWGDGWGEPDAVSPLAGRGLTAFAGLGKQPEPQQQASGFKPNYLILHDYGGSPKNQDGVFNPYHALVFPDGSVRYRNQENPYGAPAPHAYRLNPQSVGLSYAGAVGSTPTEAALASLRAEKQRIEGMFPGIKVMSHGEASQQTAGGPQQASKLGRGLDEASWRSQMAGPTPYGESDWLDPGKPSSVPAQPAAPPASIPVRVASASPTVAGYTQRAPTMTDAPNSNGLGLLGGFANHVNNAFQSPLFQSGAAMFAAGAHGRDIGTGFMMGGEAANKASAHALAMQKAQREMNQMQLQDKFWQNFSASDPKFAGLPPGLVAVAQGTRNTEALTQAFLKKADLDGAMKQAVALGDIKAQQEIKLEQMRHQLEMEQLAAKLKMLDGMRGNGSGQTKVRRYNPATNALE